jgi:integrase/recombinase XerD
MRHKHIKTISIANIKRCLKIDNIEYLNYLKEFKLELNLRGYSKNTVNTYNLTIKNMILFLNKDPKKIEPKDIREYLIYLKNDNNNTNKSVAMKINAIKTFLNSIKNKTATEELKVPKVDKSLPKVLTIEEMKRLLNSTINIRDKLIIRVLYSTGVRVSELTKLKINDIEKEIIHIKSGKGSKDRIIYIDELTQKMINEYTNILKPKKYVFENKDRDPLTPRTIQRIVEKCKKSAGIEKEVTPHVIRHSFATHLLQNKADIVVIKELLGHSNLTTTQIYTNISNEFRETSYKKSHPLSEQNSKE